ncbi:MAG: hypothetical protein JWN67_4888 [Actinomycetia bacterium]|nr:hypothetical protein [Actinomycetes bacterium]
MRRPWVRVVAGAVFAVAIVGWGVFGLLLDGYSIPSFANSPALDPGDHVLVRPGHAAHLDDLVVHHPPTAPR